MNFVWSEKLLNSYLIRCHPFQEIFTFRSPGDVQIQAGEVLSLDMSPESGSLFPEVGAEWLTMPDRGLFSEDEASLPKGVFSSR